MLKTDKGDETQVETQARGMEVQIINEESPTGTFRLPCTYGNTG